MGASAEFITSTVFAAIMVVIGLGAIWIVRWQTYFLIDHQSRSRKIFVPYPAQDVEHQSALMGPNISRQESMEFEDLRRPLNSTLTTNYDSRTDFGASNHPAEQGLEMASSSAPFGSAVVEQIPSTGTSNKTSSKTDGTSVLPSTTSSCNSRLYHELSLEAIENHRDALSGTIVSASPSEDTNVPGEAV